MSNSIASNLLITGAAVVAGPRGLTDAAIGAIIGAIAGVVGGGVLGYSLGTHFGKNLGKRIAKAAGNPDTEACQKKCSKIFREIGAISAAAMFAPLFAFHGAKIGLAFSALSRLGTSSSQ